MGIRMMSLLSILLLASTSLAQETALITGGFNGFEGAREGCELLNSGCPVPSFPVVSNETGGTNRAGRSDHITHITEDGLILSCGGEAADGTDDFSCLSLDVAEGSWVLHSILPVPRLKSTSVALPGIGLFILGGFKQLSSDLLLVGANEWEAGPTLPGTMDTVSYYGICSIVLTPTEVIVAGGVSPLFQIMSSTTVLDLNTREQREIGDMKGPRAWFGMATINGKVLAFGGMSPLKDSYSNILELDMETEEWVEREDTMATANGISSLASVVVQQSNICTT